MRTAGTTVSAGETLPTYAGKGPTSGRIAGVEFLSTVARPASPFAGQRSTLVFLLIAGILLVFWAYSDTFHVRARQVAHRHGFLARLLDSADQYLARLAQTRGPGADRIATKRARPAWSAAVHAGVDGCPRQWRARNRAIRRGRHDSLAGFSHAGLAGYAACYSCRWPSCFSWCRSAVDWCLR